jgi:beta-phosphoglucomutase
VTAHLAAIWDVDGTLVDTAELHFAAWIRLFGELSLPFTRDDFRFTFGRRNPEIFPELLGDRAREHDLTELADRKEGYYRAAAAASGVTLLPGVRPLLDALPEAGFAQAIGSSAPRENLDFLLDLIAIRPLFGAVIAAEDAKQGKPHPEVFLTAAERVRVPPSRCLVFEDAVVGVQAARAAGMRCIAVTFSGHSTADALAAAGADLVVPSLEKLSTSDVRALLA